LELKDRKVRAQLRRNIGRWLRSDGAPERRGDPLIPYKDIPRFKEITFKVIQNLESRSLEDFRKVILPHLKRIREENGLRFSDNMLKKHKWSKFLQDHPDLKESWERLPRTKNSKKDLSERYDKEKTNDTSDYSPELDSLFYKNDSRIFEDEIDEQMTVEDELEFANINIKINSPDNLFGNDKEEAFSFSSNLFSQTRFCGFMNPEEHEDSAGNILREWKERSSKFTNFHGFYPSFEMNHFILRDKNNLAYQN